MHTQKIFNIYFISSLIFFIVMFFIGLYDDEMLFVNNTPYLITLLLSLLNMGIAVYLFNQPIDNYYQDKD